MQAADVEIPNPRVLGIPVAAPLAAALLNAQPVGNVVPPPVPIVGRAPQGRRNNRARQRANAAPRPGRPGAPPNPRVAQVNAPAAGNPNPPPPGGHGPGVAPQVAPPVAPAAPAVAAPFSALRLAMTHPMDVVAKSDLETYCRQRHYPFNIVPVPGNYNEHNIGATNRRKCTLHVLGKAQDDGFEVVRDYWGNHRTPGLAAALSRRDARFTLRVEVVGGPVVPADVHRRDALAVVPPPAVPTAMCLVNVYALGQEKFTPANLHALLVNGGMTTCYWVGHRFEGGLGKIDVVGAYYRPIPGTVVIHRPSPKERAYINDPLDWMLDDGYTDGLAWTLEASYGDCHVVRLYLSAPLVTSVQTMRFSGWTSVDLPDTRRWSTWLATRILPQQIVGSLLKWNFLAKRPGLVDRKLVALVKRKTRGLKLNSYQYHNLITRLDAELHGPEYNSFTQCFPDELDQVITDTYLAGTLELLDSEGETLALVNDVAGQQIADRSGELNKYGGPYTGSSWTPALIVGAVLLAVSNPKLRSAAMYGLGRTLILGAKFSDPLACLFPERPRLSAVVEEAVRDAATLAHPLLGAAVALLFGRMDGGSLDYRSPFIAHLLLFGLSLFSPYVALAVHFGWNSVFRHVRPNTRWSAFKKSYLEAPVESLRPMIAADVSYCQIPLDEMKIANRAEASPYRHCPLSTINEPRAMTIDALASMQTPPHFHYAVLALNAPWFVPSQSGDMLASMVVRKLLKPTPLEERFPLAEALEDHLARVWEPLTRWYGLRLEELRDASALDYRLLIMDDEDGPVRQRWRDHLPQHNKQKLLDASEQIGNAQVVVTTTQQKGKDNEKLFKRASAPPPLVLEEGEISPYPEEGTMDITMRPISVVDPKVVARTGPSILEATKRYKDLFYDLPSLELRSFSFEHEGRTRSCCVLIGPFSDMDMARLLFALETKCFDVTIFAAGDDQLGILCPSDLTGNKWVVLEGDFSTFDVSQFGPALSSAMLTATILGVQPHITDLLMASAMSDQELKTRIGRMYIFRPLGGRSTGGADTSFGNSDITAKSTIGTLLSCNTWTAEALRLSLPPAYRELGLGIKLTVSEGLTFIEALEGRTFLKNVLVRSLPDPLWGVVLLPVPLPSRVLKVGVTLKDPRQLYPTARNDMTVASYMYMRDQARAYHHSWKEPILAALVARFSDGQAQERVDKEDVYRMMAADPTQLFMGRPRSELVPDPSSSWACRRYSCSPDAIAELAWLISTSPLPGFIEHPLAEKMARADYA